MSVRVKGTKYRKSRSWLSTMRDKILSSGVYINQTTVMFHSLFKGKDTPPCLQPKQALFNILNSLKTIPVYKLQRNISLNFQLTSSFCLIMLSS